MRLNFWEQLELIKDNTPEKEYVDFLENILFLPKDKTEEVVYETLKEMVEIGELDRGILC